MKKICLGVTKKEILELIELELLKDFKVPIELYFANEPNTAVRESWRLDENFSIPLETLINICKDKGFLLNILFNLPCVLTKEKLDNDVNKIEEAIDLGIDTVTIGSFELLLNLLSVGIPLKKLKLSTVREISELRDIQFFRNLIGEIILSTSINRNISYLEELAKLDFSFELIANESCLFKCPIRTEHFMIEGMSRWCGNKFPYSLCNFLLGKHDQFLAQSTFLLPETIKNRNVFKTFSIKLSTRTLPLDRKLRILRQYASGSTNNNIFDLFPHVKTQYSEKQLYANIPISEIKEKIKNGWLQYYI